MPLKTDSFPTPASCFGHSLLSLLGLSANVFASQVWEVFMVTTSCKTTAWIVKPNWKSWRSTSGHTLSASSKSLFVCPPIESLHRVSCFMWRMPLRGLISPLLPSLPHLHEILASQISMCKESGFMFGHGLWWLFPIQSICLPIQTWFRLCIFIDYQNLNTPHPQWVMWRIVGHAFIRPVSAEILAAVSIWSACDARD